MNQVDFLLLCMPKILHELGIEDSVNGWEAEGKTKNHEDEHKIGE